MSETTESQHKVMQDGEGRREREGKERVKFTRSSCTREERAKRKEGKKITLNNVTLCSLSFAQALDLNGELGSFHMLTRSFFKILLKVWSLQDLKMVSWGISTWKWNRSSKLNQENTTTLQSQRQGKSFSPNTNYLLHSSEDIEILQPKQEYVADQQEKTNIFYFRRNKLLLLHIMSSLSNYWFHWRSWKKSWQPHQKKNITVDQGLWLAFPFSSPQNRHKVNNVHMAGN